MTTEIHSETQAAYIAGMLEAKRIAENWDPDTPEDAMTMSTIRCAQEEIGLAIQAAVDAHRAIPAIRVGQAGGQA